VFKIHNASTEDIPLVRDLTFRVWPQTYASLLSPEQIEYMLELMYSESSLAEQMDKGIRFIIVYDEQTPVGFAAYEKTGDTVWKLQKLYILSSQQGKGTGRYVIDHIIREITDLGATALQLQVKRDNKARFFYDKLGFTIIDEKDFDIGNGYFMMDYIMEKKL
jgi:ribosomal protein S18 acetylase RimI-like enzyme